MKLKFSFVMTALLLLVSAVNVSASDNKYWSDDDICKGHLPRNGIEGGVFCVHIATPEEFGYYSNFIWHTNNSEDRARWEGATIILDSDIDLSKHKWMPIGENAGTFRGTLDGKNHTIKNMEVAGGGRDHHGLFDTATGNITIKNVTFENCKTDVSNSGDNCRVAIVLGALKNGGSFTADNVTFKSCGMRNRRDTGLLVGYFFDNCTIDIKNINIEDCHIFDAHDSSGFLVGKAVSAKSISFKNITVKNSRWDDDVINNGGALAGFLNCNGATVIEDIVVYNVHMIVNESNCGMLVGQMESNNSGGSLTVDNIDIQKCEIRCDGHNGGGMFGLLMTPNATIKNSYVQCDFGKKGDIRKALRTSGGLVGWIKRNNTTLSIDNCSISADDNFWGSDTYKKGGFIGAIEDGASIDIRNSVITCSQVNAGTHDTGLFVGVNLSGRVSIYRCYTNKKHNSDQSINYFEDNAKLTQYSNELRECAMGTDGKSTPGTVYYTYDEVYPFAYGACKGTLTENLYCVALMNERGSRFTVDNAGKIKPLKNTDNGFIKRYTIAHLQDVTLQPNNSDANSYTYLYRGIIGKTGKDIRYTVTNLNGRWINADNTANMTDKKFISRTELSGKPTYNHEKDKLMLDIRQPLTNTIPMITFDQIRQEVLIKWQLKKGGEELAQENKSKPYWKIFRSPSGKNQWTELARVEYTSKDSLYQYSDQTPLVGQKVDYRIELYRDDIFFGDGSLGGTTRATVNCLTNVEIGLDIKQKGNDHSVKVTVPRSKLFDGSNVYLIRWNTSEEPSQLSSEIQQKSREGKISIIALIDSIKDLQGLHVDSLKYTYVEDRMNNVVVFDFSESFSASVCSRTNFIAVSTAFKTPEYSSKAFISQIKGVTPPSSVKLYNFSATKGISPTKINLTWETKVPSSDDVMYVIQRKVYKNNNTENNITDNIDEYQDIAQLKNKLTRNTYTDEVLPGYVYQYQILAYPACDETYMMGVYDIIDDIGFSASRGSIMGKVDFSSGTKVEDVDVRLVADEESLINKEIPSYSRGFSKETEVLRLATGLSKNFWNGDWTLQFMLKPLGNKENSRLLTIPGLIAMNINGQRLTLADKSMAITDQYMHMMIKHTNSTLYVGYAETPETGSTECSHWMIKVPDSDMAKWLKNNGEDKRPTADTLFFGHAPSSKIRSFVGYIDEVRLWKDTLAENAIYQTFDRYISGNEANLYAYYTFDDGVNEWAFDTSHPGGNFNNRNVFQESGCAQLYSGTDQVPTIDELSYKGTTNERGEYSINGIPYTGEGTTYDVTPFKGVHKFSPVSSRRLISANSMTHSDVNFTDVSSFDVTIDVRYAWGDYPAEGIQILVDGKKAQVSNGTATTDDKGKCTISVPIGSHAIKVTADGHTFANNGFPCSITKVNEDGTFQVTAPKDTLTNLMQQPTAALTFFDQTQYRLAGRVVGGTTEANKPMGGRLSKANVGQVKLTLKPIKVSGYNLNNTDKDITLAKPAEIDKIHSTTQYVRGSRIRITTDPETGEFLALVPPIEMEVDTVETIGNKGGTIDNEGFGVSKTPSRISFDLTTLSADTLGVDKENNPILFKYNAQKHYTYYEKPSVEITSGNSSHPLMLGDSIHIESFVDVKDTMSVVTTDSLMLWKGKYDGTADSYVINGMPVFTSAQKYNLNLKFSEIYKNRDDGKDTAYDINKVKTTFYNEWGSATAQITTIENNQVMNDTLDYVLVPDTVGVELESDSLTNGTLAYSFVAGFPNMAGDHSLKFQFKYEIGGVQYDSDIIKGLVCGSVAVPGSDFIAGGPSKVDFILRDPPGSSSTAWIEKGSSFNVTYKWSETGAFNVGASGKRITTIGNPVYAIIAGLPAVPQMPMELYYLHQVNVSESYVVITDASHGGDLTVTGSGGNEKNTTYTFNEKVSTSSSKNYVGDKGDIFIGTNSNVVYSRTRNIGIYSNSSGKYGGSDKKHKYDFGEYQSEFSCTQKITSSFIYTKSHIESELIPELRNFRKGMMYEEVDPSELANVPTKIAGDKARYIFAKGVDHNKTMWVAGKDYVLQVPKSNEGYNDTISVLCQQIQGWENALRQNDSIKYHTPEVYASKYTTKIKEGFYEHDVEYGYLGNVSYDAGASKTATNTMKTGTGKNYGVNYSATGTLWSKTFNTHKTNITGGESKIEITGAVKLINTGSFTWSESSSNTTTIGYQLSDPNVGSYYSIDVYIPGSLDGSHTAPASQSYVFRTMGGQSKCPYQAPEYSKYYKVNNAFAQLNKGTISTEVPQLRILSSKTISNAPVGQPVFVDFEVANTSDATVRIGSNLILKLVPKSNPNGHEVYVDGIPIGTSSNYDFYLLPKQTVKKTMKIVPVNTSNLSSDDLIFWLVSSCDPNNQVFDTLHISFAKVASPIKIKQSAFVINKATIDETKADPTKGFKITVSDFDPSYEGFEGIIIQRKRPNEGEWSTIKAIVNDVKSDYWKENIKAFQKISGKDTIRYWIPVDAEQKKHVVPIDMTDVEDGTFLFRAETFCMNGTERISNYSDTLSVIKDTTCPQLFTKPTGYYDGTNDIELVFTEELDDAMLKDGNFHVTGVLKDGAINHQSGLHFDGTTPAKTSSRVDIFGGDSRSLAFWYKPVAGKQSCLFSQTFTNASIEGGSQQLALYYNADSTLSVQVGDNIYRSVRKAPAKGAAGDAWMYVAMSMEVKDNHQEIRLYNYSDGTMMDQSLFQIIDNATITGETNVPLFIGGAEQYPVAEGTTNACYADIEGFVVYESKRDSVFIAKDKDNRHTANTRGIMAYWPMDEGKGTVAREIVRERNLTIQNTDGWYKPFANYALNLDANKQQYMLFKTDNCSVLSDEDYVLEFWFRQNGTASGTQTLLSNGWGGAGSPEANLSQRLSIDLGQNGDIIVNAGGYTKSVGGGYNDDQWHHVALNVQRDAYVTVLVDTVDVTGGIFVSGSDLGGFQNSQMSIGARRYNDGNQYVVNNYFNGYIDELRLWRSYRTAQVIKNNAHARLNGDEPGLVTYYPFEVDTLVANQRHTWAVLADQVKKNADADVYPSTGYTMYGTNLQDSAQIVEAFCLENGPRLKRADFQDVVSMNYKFNSNDRIVLSFSDIVKPERIEGCELNFTVRDIFDTHGNKMKDPYTWTVYVNQNPLIWSCDNTSFVQTVSQTQTAKITILNYGNSTQAWSIDNIPSWVTLSKTSGTLKPYETTTIDLQTVAGTPMGNYQTEMYLSTDNGLSNPMGLSLAVTNIRPDWKLDACDGDLWMTIFASLKINDCWATNENDLVAVFDNQNHCLALTSPKYSEEKDKYFVQLNIRNNNKDNMQGRELKVYVWESATGTIYNSVDVLTNVSGELKAVDKLTFAHRKIMGNYTNPCVIATKNVISQVIDLHKGWNWISLWVKPNCGNKASSIFAPITNYGFEIKARTFGANMLSLEGVHSMTIEPSESYHVYVNRDVKLTLTGEKVDATTVKMTFHQSKKDYSWHWIGYPLNNTKTVGQAFADFNPQQDDIIKNSNQFSMYDSHKWLGDLQYLEPGKGYVYGYTGDGSTKDVDWYYPATLQSEGGTSNVPACEVSPYDYEDYTFVTVSIDQNNYAHNYVLAAYDKDGVCRGVNASSAYKPCTMCIYGDEGEQFSFVLYDVTTQTLVNLYGTKDFDSVTPLQELNLSTTPSGIDNVNEDDDEDTRYYMINGVQLLQRPNMPCVYIRNNEKKLNTDRK